MQFRILKARHLQQEFVVANKTAHSGNCLALLLIFVMVQQLLAFLQEKCKALLLLAGYFIRI